MKRLIYLLMPVLMAMVSVSCGREPLPQGQDGKDPVLETMEATGVSQTKATLNAKLEMDGVQYAELVCGFKLGTSDRRLDQFLSCEKTGDAYSTSLSALTDNTKYWYQAYAKVDGKEYSGAIISFTTEKLPKGAVNLGFVMTREDGTEYTLFWAESNLCESGLCAKPEDYGDYYAWAETEPYYTEGHSQDRPCTSWRPGRSTYYWPSYKWCNGAYDKLTKYCHTTKKNYWDGEGNPDGMLSLKDNDYKDDVARVKLGGKWRIPTYAEWKELMNRCGPPGTESMAEWSPSPRAATAFSFLPPAAGKRRGSPMRGNSATTTRLRLRPVLNTRMTSKSVPKKSSAVLAPVVSGNPSAPSGKSRPSNRTSR